LAINVGVLIYGLIPLVVGALLFLLRLPDAGPVGRLLVSLLLVVGVVNFGSASFPADVVGLLESTALLCASIVAGLGVFLELRTWPRRTLDVLLLSCVSIVLVLGALEAFTAFDRVSISVRETLYSADGQFLYSSDDRDMFFYGVVRPKIFTQEPSHPAKFLAFGITAWFLISQRARTLGTALFLFGVALYVLRSPTLFVGPVLAIFLGVLGGDSRGSDMRLGLRLAALVLCVVATVTLPSWIGIVPTPRAQDIASGADTSTVIRLVGPIEIAGEILREQPLFGAGIGGKEYAWDALASVYANYPGITSQRFLLVPDSGWGNAFFQFVAYCGVIGSLVFLWWVAQLSKQLIGADWVSMLFAFFLIFNMDGAFNTARPWVYFFLIASAYHLGIRDRVLAQQAADSRRSWPQAAVTRRHVVHRAA